ncbi:MAG: thioredoxin domain-containing protein [Elusimicrobia bacterium]|nr:thioredoxin domain-containing protein [Elusimicrobiota bacterium]
MIIPCLMAALAASAAEPALVLSHPATAVLNERLELKPVPGHHFNVDAPQKCGKNKADEVTPRVFRCRLASSGEVPVVASVCDDAKTFCRQERFTVSVSGRKRDAERARLAPKPHPFAAGFLVNEPGKAVTLARRAHEPIFVHFYGIWCPPCNMLEEGVYPTAAFAKASEGFVLLALDADAELSWDWKARFKVGGYPTLLVLDERGQEVSRAVGYRSPESLAAFLRESKALMNEPIEVAAQAVAKSSPAGDGARRARVARWRFERGEYAEAVTAAGAAPESRREALLASRELAAKNDDARGVLAALTALTAEYADDAEFADWASDLVERDRPAAEALEGAVRASAAKWAADPKLSEHGLVPGDMRASEASFLESLGKEADAKAAWSAAAEAYGGDAKASTLKLARGANLERAYCLAKAGRLGEARALYDSLVGAYPDEFTFHYGYARLLFEQKELPSALISARAAVKTGYGDNWLRAVALEAKILKAMGLKEEAAKSLDAALSEAAAPKSAAVRTHRYLAELRRLRAEL